MRVLSFLPGIPAVVLTVALASSPFAEAATKHRASRASQPPSYNYQPAPQYQAPPQSGAPIRTPCWPCV
jgi:hypothetical protein